MTVTAEEPPGQGSSPAGDVPPGVPAQQHKLRLRHRAAQASPALKFVLLVGVMSFFADFTYEGSRSIIGPYLGTLGAGALAIAVITRAGEFLGYGLQPA